uniref:Uncharacterized protein n=1 Tax=Oryza glumipatula TaxID=40148 RepID=A0A0E0B905_9ORYZ
MEVAAATPPYPSKSELAAVEVAPCAWGRIGGQTRRRHLWRIHAGSAIASSASMPDTPHRSRIRVRGARSGCRMRRLLASRPQSSVAACSQPWCARSA